MTQRSLAFVQILVSVPMMLVGWWLMKPTPESGSRSSEECEEAAYLDPAAPHLVRCYPRGDDLDDAEWYPLYAGAEPKDELIDPRSSIVTIDPAFPIEQSIEVTDTRGVRIRVRLQVLPGTTRPGLCGEPPGPGSEVVPATLFVENVDKVYVALMPGLALEGVGSDEHPLQIEAFDDDHELYCVPTIEAGKRIDPGGAESFPISVTRAVAEPSSRLSVVVGEHSDQRLEVTVPRSRTAA